MPYNEPEWTEADFQIIRRLGKGSFAEVFLAIEKRSNKKVALKKISK
jgi:serine/threonine protein kinase